MKRAIPAALFALALLSTAHAQLTLVTTGGTFGVNNFATSGTAFAFDVLQGGSNPAHQISHLNDGTYGNSFSWIGNAGSTYAGIILATPITLTSFAFGRDNTGALTDRDAGTYTIQYSYDPISGFNAATATWTTIQTLNYGTTPPTSPYLRHLYSVDAPLTGVTAIRILTQGGIAGTGQAIDEIEIYGTAIPEPATWAALMGAAVLGVVSYRRRGKAVRS